MRYYYNGHFCFLITFIRRVSFQFIAFYRYKKFFIMVKMSFFFVREKFTKFMKDYSSLSFYMYGKKMLTHFFYLSL